MITQSSTRTLMERSKRGRNQFILTVGFADIHVVVGRKTHTLDDCDQFNRDKIKGRRHFYFVFFFVVSFLIGNGIIIIIVFAFDVGNIDRCSSELGNLAVVMHLSIYVYSL